VKVSNIGVSQAEDMKSLRILNLEAELLGTELIRTNLIEDGISCEILRV
jgi:hypothetical protein